MVQAREEIWATFIGAERYWIRERIGRIKSAEITAAASGRDFRPEERDDKGDPHVCEEGGGRIPVLDFEILGRGPLRAAGRKVSRGPFLFFPFLFDFLFCFLFVNFAKTLQIDSNQFLKFVN
jgi:hypothetical protein